jgi:Glycosyltransferase family 87
VQDLVGAPDETAPSPWSVWGIRLVAVQSVAIVVSLAWGWIETFYRQVGFNGLLSANSSDRELTPPFPLYETARPIIGNHYFSDFQLPLAYAINLRHGISPYFSPNPPTRYPPFSQVLFTPFSYLPLREAAITYLAFSVTVFLMPLWLLLAPLKFEYRVIFLIPVAVMTTPFISLLDRGNDIGIVVGLIAWSIWAWKSERWVLCGALLTAAIALKVYPAGLLVVPFALRRYRFTILVVASALVVNLLAIATYPGGYFRNIRAVLPALENTSPMFNQMSSWSVYSVIPKTVGLVLGPSAIHHLLAPKSILIWLPSILYLCGVYLVIRRERVPQWCWGPLALASIQLIAPLSFVYTTAWAPLAAVWFAWGCLVDVGQRRPTDEGAPSWLMLRITLLLALVASLAPSVFPLAGLSGFRTPMAQYLSPMLLLVTLCIAIVYSLRQTKIEAVAVSVE